MDAGDIVMLNDPFQGGTHLPDITLVSPVFLGRDYSRVSQKRHPGWSRVYARVLVEGALRAGDGVRILSEREAGRIGVPGR